MLQGVSFKSPLYQMTQTTGTCLWNDSAAEAELAYAIDNGAVGATCNPVIAVEVVKKELMHWSELIGGDVVISPPHVWQKRRAG
jgi:transaldolase